MGPVEVTQSIQVFSQSLFYLGNCAWRPPFQSFDLFSLPNAHFDCNQRSVALSRLFCTLPIGCIVTSSLQGNIWIRTEENIRMPNILKCNANIYVLKPVLIPQ